MTDLFQDKAEAWDTRPIPAQISEGVSQAMLNALELSAETSILDFGAGTGLVCAKLAPSVGEIIAVDISEAMLAQLAEKQELRDKVEIVCQDIINHPLQRQVDVIVSAMAMHHVQDTVALFESFSAHLPSGGRLALADLDSEEGDFHPEGVEGVFHNGFDRGALTLTAEAAGFEAISFQTAAEVHKDDKRYPIFLMTAIKP